MQIKRDKKFINYFIIFKYINFIFQNRLIFDVHMYVMHVAVVLIYNIDTTLYQIQLLRDF